ncbi:MAG: calcium/sodium antiporter [Patescibacteria group bacterium]|nr:calcium/sodium antiporter [Patescibacteria group bacterium]
MDVFLILTFVAGFIFLIKGANLLVTGSSSLAKNFGVSDLFIGLTIVAFGTSAPELIVNINAAIRGGTDIGIGNILGSNITNIFLILGISSLVVPLVVKLETIRLEIPLSLLAVVLLWFMVSDGVLSRFDGLIFVLLFLAFLSLLFRRSRRTVNFGKFKTSKAYSKKYSIFMILAGLVGLFFGGEWLVSSSIELAKLFGISDAVIGLTVIAFGTTLPEMAASLTAVYKRKKDIAVGNVVGSNIFNIFFILGLAGLIRPITVSNDLLNGVMAVIFATLMLLASLFVGKKYVLEKWQGVYFVITYLVYVIYIFYVVVG